VISHVAKTHENVVLFPAMNFSPIFWDFWLILAFLAVVIPWRGKVRVERLMRRADPDTSDRLSLYASTIAAQWIIAALILWRALARGMNLADLGMTVADPWKTSWVTLVLTLVLCAGQLAGLRKLVRIPAENRGALFGITEKIMPRTPAESIVFAALAITAGISEEFLYRGFVFVVFARLFAGTLFPLIYAGGMASAWFAVAHLYQGRKGIITTCVVGVIFVFIRVYSDSLLPPVIAHMCIDLMVGLALPRLLGKT